MFGLGASKEQKARDKSFMKWVRGEINSGVTKLKVASGRKEGVSKSALKEAKSLCKSKGVKAKI
jgi:hypothetical protein